MGRLLSSPAQRREEKRHSKYHNADLDHNSFGRNRMARAATLPWGLKSLQGEHCGDGIRVPGRQHPPPKVSTMEHLSIVALAILASTQNFGNGGNTHESTWSDRHGGFVFDSRSDCSGIRAGRASGRGSSPNRMRNRPSPQRSRNRPKPQKQEEQAKPVKQEEAKPQKQEEQAKPVKQERAQACEAGTATAGEDSADRREKSASTRGQSATAKITGPVCTERPERQRRTRI